MTSKDPNELNQLVNDCLSRMESEGEAAIDEVCREHPEHAESLRRRIDRLQSAGLLNETVAEADPGVRRGFPEQLGEFRLLEKLGAGGMGVVYLAEQENVGRKVALKLVRPELLYFDGARSRFQREVEAVGKLQHPGIVAIHAVGEEEGVPYFAMEYITGCSLSEVVEDLRDRDPKSLSGADLAAVVARRSGTTLDEETRKSFAGTWTEACCRLLRKAASALHHAHDQGVLHRDLKPSNLMITPAGRVVILDFGLATAEGSGKLTRPGSQLGSLDYMSPEQLRQGADAMDQRSDVYALGVTLHELLTLRSPYRAKTEAQVRAKILEGRVRRLREVNPAVPRDAETVCLAAMEHDPARRYESAAEFARDLDNFLSVRPITARRAGTWLRLRRWGQRHPARALAAALAMLVVLGGPIGYAWTEHSAAKRIGIERDQAERNLQKALAALDEIGTEVGANQLMHVPHMQPLRREVLERTLEFYLDFLADRPNDPRLWDETAGAWFRVAMTRAQLGSMEAAKDAFAESTAMWQKLVDANPGDAGILFDLVQARVQFDQTRATTGKENAEQTLLATAGFIREALADYPDDRALLDQLAVVYQVLFRHHRGRGEAEKRDQALAECVRLREQLAEEYPEVDRYRFGLSAIYTDYVVVLAYAGKLDAADAYADSALGLLTDLCDEEPDNPDYRQSMAQVYVTRGIVQQQRKEYAKAHDEYRQALRLQELQLKEFPNTPRHESDIGGTLNNIAMILNRMGSHESAMEQSKLAITHQRRALSISPGHVVYGRFLCNHYTQLCYAYLGQGLHRDAATWARGLMRLAPKSANARNRAVRIVQECARLCTRDSALSAADRRRIGDDYAKFLRGLRGLE